jgi:amidase
MTPLSERPAVQLAKLVRDREVGCLELLDYFIERVTRLDPSTNAVVVKDFERARDRACWAPALASHLRPCGPDGCGDSKGPAARRGDPVKMRGEHSV